MIERMQILDGEPRRAWLGALLAVALLLLLIAGSSPTLAGASAPEATAAAKTFKRCGSQPNPGAGWYRVRAHNVGCRVARRVARHYWNTGDSEFNGWSCRHRQVGDEDFKARCRRERADELQIVKFRFGA